MTETDFSRLGMGEVREPVILRNHGVEMGILRNENRAARTGRDSVKDAQRSVF